MTIYVDHGDGDGERPLTALTTPQGTVETIYVNHGDGGGERRVWSAGSDGVLSIDTFTDGTFNAGWLRGTDAYTITADDTATDGHAAYRDTSEGALVGDDTGWEKYPQRGNYLVWSFEFRADETMQMVQMAENESVFTGNRIEFVCGQGFMEIRSGGGETVTSTEVSLPANKYLTAVGHVDKDDVAHFWVYDASETELGQLDGAIHT